MLLLLLREKEKAVVRRAVARVGWRHGGGHGGISPNSLLSAPPLEAGWRRSELGLMN
jgi:hypothetical protein